MNWEGAEIKMKQSDGIVWEFTIINISGDIVNINQNSATISFSGLIVECKAEGSDANIGDIPNIRMIRI